MTHKAGASFFDMKRSWSERKDLVLGYYLKPYLPKIATQGRPILLVDGFAGPGGFKDGKEGSPLILCQAAWRMPLRVPVRVMCIEREKDHCHELRERLAKFKDATVREGDFRALLPEIEQLAKTHSVFLYLDPFTVTGLSWNDLDKVFRWVRAQSSIEVLLNFSGSALTRIGCAALHTSDTVPEEEGDSTLEGGTGTQIADLDDVLGGPWWQSIIRSGAPFPEKVQSVTAGYCDMLRTRFNEVCHHDIFEVSTHKVPKYTLVFGSRHPDALVLMNDAAVKSRGQLAEDEAPSYPVLFEMRSETLVPDLQKLPACVISQATARMTRKELVAAVIRSDFGRYSESQIKKCIGQLVQEGKLRNDTGKSKMNDEVKVWRPTSGID